MGCFFIGSAQFFGGILIQMDGAVEILGTAAGPAAAGAGTGTGAGAAAGTGTVATAAEAALPTALGRAGPGLGAHTAGPGTTSGTPGVPQTIDKHIAGTEAPYITAYGGKHRHNKANNGNHNNEADDGGDGIAERSVTFIIAAVIIVLGDIFSAVLAVQGGRPIGIGHGQRELIAIAHAAGGEDMVAALGVTLAGDAGDAGGVVPGEGHLVDENAVKPAGGVVIGYLTVIEGIHVLLNPGEGEIKLLPGLIALGEIHIGVAVVVLDVGNIVGQGLHIPDGAVGDAYLYAALLAVGGREILQRLPAEG